LIESVSGCCCKVTRADTISKANTIKDLGHFFGH
jgi:hypothetical protein